MDDGGRREGVTGAAEGRPGVSGRMMSGLRGRRRNVGRQWLLLAHNPQVRVDDDEGKADESEDESALKVIALAGNL